MREDERVLKSFNIYSFLVSLVATPHNIPTLPITSNNKKMAKMLVKTVANTPGSDVLGHDACMRISPPSNYIAAGVEISSCCKSMINETSPDRKRRFEMAEIERMLYRLFTCRFAT